MPKIFRLAAIGLGALVLLVVLVLAIAPRLVPADTYREAIVREAEKATGRTVSVEGPVSVAAFPQIAARAGQVSIANPGGFSEPTFAQIEELRARLSLFSLIFGRVEVNEFVLVEPQILLEKRRDGAVNWVLGAVADTDGAAAPVPQASSGPFERTPGAADYDVRLGDIRLVGGQVRYRDRQAGVSHDLTDLQVTLSLPALDRRAEVSGGFRLNDASMVVDARIDTLKGFLEGAEAPFRVALEGEALAVSFDGAFDAARTPTFTGRFEGDVSSLERLAQIIKLEGLPAQIVERVSASGQAAGSFDAFTLTNADVRLESDVLRLTVDGTATVGPDITYGGEVALNVRDVRALAAAFDTVLPEGRDIYRAFAVSGRADGTAQAITFQNASVSFDDITAEGGLRIGLTGERPKLTGTLDLPNLDLSPYAGPAGDGGKEAGRAGGGWSDEPIDLTALRQVDADLTLTARNLKLTDIEIDRAEIRAVVQNGRLEANLTDLTAYEAQGVATLIANARSDVPSYEVTANLLKFDALPFLQATANFSRLIGEGDGTITLSAEGQSPASIMASLSGDGGFTFRDGMLKGVNLPAAAQSIQQALDGDFSLAATALGRNAETAFESLVGAFTVEKGVARIQDFTVDGAGIAVTGGGSLDLVNQQVGLTLAPQVTGAGLAQIPEALHGIPLPLAFQGGWGQVSIGLDQDALQAAIGARAEAAARSEVNEALGEAIDRNLEGAAGEALRGVLGLPGSTPTPQTPAGTEGEAQAEESGEEAASPPVSAEDAVRDAVRNEVTNALGGLFGSRSDAPPPSEPAPDTGEDAAQDETPEEPGDDT